MSKGNASSTSRILVVDDHSAARESVADVLRHAGYKVACAASAVEALGQLARESFDVVITDLQMPGMDGLELIRQINTRQFTAQVLMITAHATIASAVEAMRHGAFDYLEKPFDATRLEELVRRALERGRLLQPDAGVTNGRPEFAGMIGDSRVMRELRGRIAQIAPTNETVLVCGESGTGKELVARAIHDLSRCSTGPLVSLNCPALSAQLTESELFGHRRGAFTGADADRVGRFELAEGGTILLDEITEIDLPLQAKLLRVLQERTYERVGCSETRVANVRVVASTNRDLNDEVATGRFRQDLYYRLAVVPVTLPPLREREDDVQLLADHFLDRAAQRLNRPACQLEQSARELFGAYHWPGNVRELENIITRACVLNPGQAIAAEQLRPWLQQPDRVGDSAEATLPVGVRLEDMERHMILTTLQRYDGHRAKAAEALGIGVRTLSGKLRTYGIAPHARDFSGPTVDDRQILPTATAAIAECGARRTA